MGDRVTIGLRDGDNTLYLYQHWGGQFHKRNLARALQSTYTSIELGDVSYANRIILSRLIGGDWDNNCAGGITINRVNDSEYDVPVVDVVNKTISIYEYDWDKGMSEKPLQTLTISEYCEEQGVKYATV